jgi:hypothetical protein
MCGRHHSNPECGPAGLSGFFRLLFEALFVDLTSISFSILIQASMPWLNLDRPGIEVSVVGSGIAPARFCGVIQNTREYSWETKYRSDRS